MKVEKVEVKTSPSGVPPHLRKALSQRKQQQQQQNAARVPAVAYKSHDGAQEKHALRVRQARGKFLAICDHFNIF